MRSRNPSRSTHTHTAHPSQKWRGTSEARTRAHTHPNTPARRGGAQPKTRALEKDVLELCPRSFDVFLQVGFVVENPRPKQQVEQGLNMDRINEINDWFWNPV